MFSKILKKCMHAAKLRRLDRAGMKVGPGSFLFPSVGYFGSEPYLIHIGSNCIIAGGVHFITHDGAIRVFNRKEEFRSIDNKYGKIDIKDNVYIGENSIIMPNVTIGPNAYILPGSVVYKDIPCNSAAAGNPAVVQDTREDFKEYYDKELYPCYKNYYYKSYMYVMPYKFTMKNM